MTGKAIQDLVGRVMVDRAFLAELIRDPDTVLAGYELTPDERAAVMQAIGHGIQGSEQDTAEHLQDAMLRRWAT